MEPETGPGDAGREFPPTSWSLVARFRDSDTSQRRMALESLGQRYWKAVYHFARRAWSKSDDDAKDLTQGFFCWLLEGEPLRKYSPEKGGFRKYLKSLLRHFAADQYDRETALKKGGGVKILTLDGPVAPLKDFVEDGRSEDPDRAFDMAWKQEILSRALERARQWFTSSGRVVQFRAFEEYDLAETDPGPTYSQVAAKLGIKETDVRNWLSDVRERLRTEIRMEISQTVADMGELEDEWKNLFEK